MYPIILYIFEKCVVDSLRTKKLILYSLHWRRWYLLLFQLLIIWHDSSAEDTWKSGSVFKRAVLHLTMWSLDFNVRDLQVSSSHQLQYNEFHTYRIFSSWIRLSVSISLMLDVTMVTADWRLLSGLKGVLQVACWRKTFE